MKQVLCFAICICGSILFGSARAEAQTTRGEQICLDPPTCNSYINGSAMAGFYAKNASDQLGSLITLLEKISASTTENTKTLQATLEAIKTKNKETTDLMDTILITRFNQLPVELLTHPVFKGAFDDLRKRIMEDVKQMLPQESSPPKR